MKRGRHDAVATTPPLNRLTVLPSGVLLKIALCLADASTMFAFLDLLETADARGPLEHLWQLGRLTGDRTKLWPSLCLFGTDDATASADGHVDAFIQYYSHVIVDGEYDLAWLRARLHPTTMTEWHSLPDEGDSDTPLADWYASWAELNVSRIHVSEMNLDPLMPHLSKLHPRLTSLTVHCAYCTALDPLVAFVATSKLTELSMHHIVDVAGGEMPMYTDAMVAHLVRWIQANPVRSVELGSCTWSVDGGAALFAALFNCPTLDSLRLIECLSPSFSALSRPLPMRVLTLECFKYPSIDLAQLSSALEGSHVERLTLRHARANRAMEGLERLIRVLPRTKITYLELSSSDLGNDALAVMAPLLPPTHLKSLVLDRNPISDIGATHLANAIQSNLSVVETLSLRDCHDVTSQGVHALIRATVGRPIKRQSITLGASDAISVADVATLRASAQTLGVELSLYSKVEHLDDSDTSSDDFSE
ncbi:Aste57867_16802 [Aphanomyces stellatus]|uniref:Aste57867_16802 protein n=1 Tax=Aphanomyces stellatus TaxID=120398 RepID=A0A485L691_9STRA|nr:hypothetical protein As57867_016745 [Aphanomyces stellatus]VFT93567.1 Aste57867_16802 [Aphanomyces stellatus]